MERKREKQPETASITGTLTHEHGKIRAEDGSFHHVPPDYAFVPPGDALLTRRVKSLGPSFTIFEWKKGQKRSLGVWAPPSSIARATEEVTTERADPRYAQRLQRGRAKRAIEQEQYVEDFEGAVLSFLRFAPRFEQEAAKMARAVAAHATPVGSGTVARTKRISVSERAEAAVIAWMRHQTTEYDSMRIGRAKGERRETRRMLAQISRARLDMHRDSGKPHEPRCPLCKALEQTPVATREPVTDILEIEL